MNLSPPKFALKFLRWFCREDYIEEIEGDLTEVFEKEVIHSPVKAKWKFRWSVMKYFRPEFIKSLKRSYQPNPIDMFMHNLLLTFRSFKRYKSTFVINLLGLSTGLACTLLIYLWVKDELSMDRFHENDKVLYQAMLNHKEATRIFTGPDTPALLAKAMDEELPEVEMATEDTNAGWFGENFTISEGKDKLKAHGKFSGANYFTMFSFEFVQGDPAKALHDKTYVAISEKLAKSLFPNEDDVLGKTVEWSLLHIKRSATVSGVFKDIDSHTSDRFDFVIPFSAYEEEVGKDGLHWGNYNAITYVQLKENADATKLNEKIGDFIKTKADWSNVTVFVRPFSDRYLYDKYENGVMAGGRISYVRMFSVIAVFIIVIACINFMNLATAKATRRLKEVGIKKSMGAGRRALVMQHMGESIIMTVLSLCVSLIMVGLFLPQFNDITAKQLSLDFDKALVWSILGITLTTGILSGSYPALYLSGFSPIAILKGRLQTSFGEVWARKGLVVFQFSLSILLIVSVIVVYQQIQFIQTKNIGYDRDNVITLPNEGKASENIELFLTEIKKVEGVANASASVHNFFNNGSYTTDLLWEGKDPDEIVRFGGAAVYFNLIETMGMQVKEGRTFSREFTNEKGNLILNETAVQVMGLTDPLGKTVKLWGEDKQIIGVVRDFHFASLHEKVEPLFFRYDASFLPHIMIKVKAGDEVATLERLKKFYSTFNPGYSFDYRFIDQNYQQLYTAEMRVATLSRYFAAFAVLISCLGLFGLATFTAERRLKEIGIRKVLGASEIGIVYLLSADFTKMVIAAMAVALPVSYILTKNWLNDFAYRIALEWWFFAAAGIMALIVAWLTIGLQTLKAARVNPSRCLKEE